MGLSITDIVALAKAGYKPADVKELITLSKEPEPGKPEEPQNNPVDKNDNTAGGTEPKKETENEADPGDDPDKVIDYKELYNKSQEDLKKSQEDLKKAQEANRSADNSGKLSEDDTKSLLETISLM